MTRINSLSQSSMSPQGIQLRRTQNAPSRSTRGWQRSPAQKQASSTDMLRSVGRESVSELFAPDMITPGQHQDQVRGEITDQPEIRLMLAVMEDAVATFQRYLSEPSRGKESDFRDTRSWLESDDLEWPYSFSNICEALGMEPELVREKMLAWETCPEELHRGLFRFPFRRVNGKRHSISLRERDSA